MQKIIVLLFIIPVLTIVGCSSPDAGESNTTAGTSGSFSSSFDYQPEPPSNGTLLGIIELSFTGFNSFIIEIDQQDRWSLKKAVYGESFVELGEITLDHVLEQLTSFKADMSALGLDENDVNLVVSSSASKTDKVKKISDQLRELNIGLIEISPEQEAAYAFQATVPESLRERSYLIDIGSGSTKISWLENGRVISKETYGSKSHLHGTSKLDVYHQLKEAIGQIPTESKSLCFLVGGVAFDLAKATNARAGRYTILKAPEEYQNQDSTQVPSGLNMYNAIWSEVTYSYVFDWEANFTIGILMDVN